MVTNIQQLEKLSHQKIKTQSIHPVREGLVVAIMVFVAICVSCLFIRMRALTALDIDIREGLLQTAKVAATVIDGDVHKTFTNPQQENSIAFQNIRDTMYAMLKADDQLRYIYTTVLRNNKVYFIIDPTSASDTSDAVHIMDPYPDASATLIQAHQTKKMTVTKEPYSDKWGTFISAYTPITDSNGVVVAILGVDMDISEYRRLIWPITRATFVVVIIAALLSVLIGSIIWFFRNYALQMQEQRNAMIEGVVHATDMAKTRMQEKSQLFANMGEDLGKPIASIKTLCQSALAKETARSQRDQLEAIENAADMLGNTVEDLLMLAAVEAGKVQLQEETFDLLRLIDNVIRVMAPEAEKKSLELVSVLGTHLPRNLYGDRKHIQQILSYLLRHAIETTSRGGVVLEISEELDMVMDESLRIRFNVIDTGAGIMPEDVPTIFKQTHSVSDDSLGIGLMAAGALVEMLLGKIEVESDPGKRTIISVVLTLDLARKGGKERISIASNLQKLLLVNIQPLTNWALTRQCKHMGIATKSIRRQALAATITQSSDTVIDWVFIASPNQEDVAQIMQLKQQGSNVLHYAAITNEVEAVSLTQEGVFDVILTQPILQKELLPLITKG